MADDVIANLVIEDDVMVVAAMKLAPVPEDVSADVLPLDVCVVIFNMVCFYFFPKVFLLYLVYYIKYNMCLMQYIFTCGFLFPRGLFYMIVKSCFVCRAYYLWSLVNNVHA